MAAEQFIQADAARRIGITQALGLMRIAKLAATFFCTIGILIVGVYTAVAMAVVFFIATGTLTPGGIMLYDSPAPSLPQALMFVVMGSIVTGGLAFARHRLSRNS